MHWKGKLRPKFTLSMRKGMGNSSEDVKLIKGSLESC